jgi:hypothetical protein
MRSKAMLQEAECLGALLPMLDYRQRFVGSCKKKRNVMRKELYAYD